MDKNNSGDTISLIKTPSGFLFHMAKANMVVVVPGPAQPDLSALIQHCLQSLCCSMLPSPLLRASAPHALPELHRLPPLPLGLLLKCLLNGGSLAPFNTPLFPYPTLGS